MPYELFLALRYLRVRRGRRVVKLTALAALVGIACGVAALIVAQALANGFRDELRDKILRGTAHLTLVPAGGGAAENPRGVALRVRGVKGVIDAAPTTYEGALLSGPGGAAYAVLRGVDAESQGALTEIRRTLVEGTVEQLFQGAKAGDARAEPDAGEPPMNVVVGAELAERTGLDVVGEEGWAIVAEKSAAELGVEPRARRLRVAGIFRSGLHDYDATWAYASYGEVAELGGGVPKSSAVSIEVRDVYATGAVAARLRDEVGAGWSVVDWREANRPLFAALELERRTVSIIIMLVLLVAALNVTTTLALVVMERRADVAVLVAMGAEARSVLLIFVLEGAAIGAAGAFAGLALGLIACALGNHFELVRLPADVYSISSVPFNVRAFDAAWPALAAFIVSLLATVYPARQAARMRPADALRYE